MGDAGDVRVLVKELGAVVDLVMDYDEHVVLGVVLGNILEGEDLVVGHCYGIV